MSTSDATPKPAALSTLRMVAGIVMGVPVLLLVVLAAAIRPDGATDTPSGTNAVFLAVVVVTAVAVTGALLTIGYRVAPIAATAPPEKAQSQAAAAFQTTFFLRLGLGEAVALVGYGLAFAATGGALWIYVVALLCAEALMLWHVWPGDGSIDRVQRNLNRDGAAVDVRRALGA